MDNRIKLNALGSLGLVKDVSAWELDVLAWSKLENIRINESGLSRMVGDMKALGTDVTGWAQNPLWLFRATAPALDFWVGAGATGVFCRGTGPSFTETVLTRIAGAYAATDDSKWNGGMFQGFLVINNGIDEPQYWDLNTANKLLGLSNLNAGADKFVAATRAKVVVPFDKYLVFLGVTQGGVSYPHLVYWSHPANPGALPGSFDYTNPARDAGQNPLTDSRGIIVDGAILRNSLVIYKEDMSHLMTYQGGNNIFRFDKGLTTQGLLGTHCVTSFGKDSDKHLCVGTDDIYLFDGRNALSILEKKMKRWLFNQIDTTFYNRSFLVANPAFEEVWFCYPESGKTQPTMALVWSWKDNTFTTRALLPQDTVSRTAVASQGTPCIALGTINTTDTEPWSSGVATWAGDASVWNSRQYSPVISRLLMADRGSGKETYVLDAGTGFGQTALSTYLVYDCVAERIGLSVTGRDYRNNFVSDLETEKLVTRIWPKVDASAGAVFYVQVGAQDTPQSGVTWDTEKSFTVGTSEFADFYIAGKLISIRFRIPSDQAVTITGYEIELVAISEL